MSKAMTVNIKVNQSKPGNSKGFTYFFLLLYLMLNELWVAVIIHPVQTSCEVIMV